MHEDKTIRAMSTKTIYGAVYVKTIFLKRNNDGKKPEGPQWPISFQRRAFYLKGTASLTVWGMR